jgi:hypothetical protein
MCAIMYAIYCKLFFVLFGSDVIMSNSSNLIDFYSSVYFMFFFQLYGVDSLDTAHIPGHLATRYNWRIIYFGHVNVFFINFREYKMDKNSYAKRTCICAKFKIATYISEFLSCYSDYCYSF